jgi:hypothetical protein
MRFSQPFVRHTGGMSRPYFRDSRLVGAALLMTAGLALGACSSNSSKPSGHSTSAQATSAPATSPASSGEPTTGSGATAAIESNWATFFNAKTPLARRLALLENGQEFATVIKAQQGQGLAALATSKVSHVSLTGTNQATVTYTIYVSGKPALKNQPGVAVYQDGVWKVGDSSFCGLLRLEQVAALPAACKA